MLSLVARCEGGMRTGDLHKWDWTMLDRVYSQQCTIPRSKTSVPQVLAIPSVLAPFLRAWWERSGEPESGPVFPARVGKSARPSTKTGRRLSGAPNRNYRMSPFAITGTRDRPSWLRSGDSTPTDSARPSRPPSRFARHSHQDLPAAGRIGGAVASRPPGRRSAGPPWPLRSHRAKRCSACATSRAS